MGRKHIGILMKRMGVESLYQKSGISKKHPGHKIYVTQVGYRYMCLTRCRRKVVTFSAGL